MKLIIGLLLITGTLQDDVFVQIPPRDPHLKITKTGEVKEVIVDEGGESVREEDIQSFNVLQRIDEVVDDTFLAVGVGVIEGVEEEEKVREEEEKDVVIERGGEVVDMDTEVVVEVEAESEETIGVEEEVEAEVSTEAEAEVEVNNNDDNDNDDDVERSRSLDELLKHMEETSQLEEDKQQHLLRASEIISNVTFNSLNSSVLISLTKSHVYEITTHLQKNLTSQRIIEDEQKAIKLNSTISSQLEMLNEIKGEIESIEEAEKYRRERAK